MKTIAIGGQNRGSTWTAITVVAGLLAFYFYRRRGGSVGALVNKTTQGVNSARDYLRKSSANAPGETTQYGGVTGRLPENA